MFNIISVQELLIRDAVRIGKFNRILGAHKVELDKSSFILQGNFIGGTWGTPLQNGSEDLLLGERSQITIGALIDLNDQVVFGKDVVAGGVRTQFWTHGFNHNRDRISGPITISDKVFLGLATIVMPNVSICSAFTIGAGTNVHRSITDPGLYVSSELVRKT